MANVELIAAKDLPTTEAEEVSVLCIDNGELKQKPGASFGGGGGYITVADELDMENMQGVINESYDNFIGVLLAGGSVWVDATSAFGMPVYLAVISWGLMEGVFSVVVTTGGAEIFLACPNGSWTPEG